MLGVRGRTQAGRPSRLLDRAIRLVSSLVVVASLAGCARGAAADPPTRIRIAVGPADGVFESVGEALATAYNAQPGLEASTQHSVNSQTSAEALERGEVDLALEGARTSYVAYRRGTQEHPAPLNKLRALAVLFPTVVHIAARRGAGIADIHDLKGHRLFVGEKGSPTEGASRTVLESHGLTFADIHPVFERDGVIDAFRNGALDAIVFFYPIHHARAVAMMRGGEATLIPVDTRMMESIRSRDPLLKPASIPPGTYDGQPQPVPTVGTDVLLVCRKDLSEDLVYRLTRVLFDSVPELSRAHPAVTSVDPGRGPGAPIPLHRGAARYYRERELFR
jgi:TRAP transporter TAXI family solute receptor